MTRKSPMRDASPELIEAALRDWIRGLSVREITRRHEISKSLLASWVEQHHLPRRPVGAFAGRARTAWCRKAKSCRVRVPRRHRVVSVRLDGLRGADWRAEVEGSLRSRGLRPGPEPGPRTYSVRDGAITWLEAA